MSQSSARLCSGRIAARISLFTRKTRSFTASKNIIVFDYLFYFIQVSSKCLYYILLEVQSVRLVWNK